jgi:very-short-patch-repair endonuclease
VSIFDVLDAQMCARFHAARGSAHVTGVSIDPRLATWARHHHGLVTLERWRAVPRSARSWYRAIESGALVAVHPGVARLPGAWRTPAQAIAAAMWSVGGDVLASHRSAAFVWGAPVDGIDPIDLVSPSRARQCSLAGVVLHRPRDDADLRPVRREGLVVTNPLRCLLDLGAVAPAAVPSTLEAFLIRGLVSVPAAEATLDRHRRRGRHGVGALAEALEDLALGDKPPDSVLEPAVAALFERHQLRDWTFHARVAGHEVDFVFADARLAIEVDGWASHGTRQQFELDRQRDADLAAVGWTVMRFTWLQVTRRATWVADRVRAALAARAPAHGSGWPA